MVIENRTWLAQRDSPYRNESFEFWILGFELEQNQ